MKYFKFTPKTLLLVFQINVFLLDLITMKKGNSNILKLAALLLYCGFFLSLSHLILHETGSKCLHHDDHDYSKIIVSTIIPHDEMRMTGNHPPVINIIPVEQIIKENLPFSQISYKQTYLFNYSQPDLYKYKSLLI